jgi:hypothetical protein
MAKGDHVYKSIWINGNPVTHHGIDCGDGYVIEHPGFLKKISRIRTLDFYQGAMVKVREYKNCDHPDIVLKRAYQVLNNNNNYCQKYDLITVNCESFVTWCKTGKLHSQQVSLVKQSAQCTFAAPISLSLGVKFVARQLFKQ